MARPYRGSGPIPADKNPHRINEEIKVATVRLVDAAGKALGDLPVHQAIDRAKNLGMDLVEIAPQARPPVCKILDYGKFKYEAQKKRSEAKKNQKTFDVKEVKFRPNIGENDYQVKMNRAKKFLENGDKVKFTLMFRGREMSHQELGIRVLDRVKEELGETIKIEHMPKLEGRQMAMVVAPVKA